jgi:glycosyltransferase involved in cell wall biosynthesis
MALELGEGLRESGVEVHFVTSRWGNGEFGRRTVAAGFPTCRLWLGFISAILRFEPIWMTLDQMRRWPSLLLGYQRFLKTTRPAKVVHTNWHHVLLMWPLVRPDRDVFWLHEVIPNRPGYRRLFKRLAKRVNCFVCVSNVAARSLTNVGVPESKTCVIYNGIIVPSGGGRKEPNTVPAIGIVGQIGAWKGHEDLLEAFPCVLEKYPKAQLHIFGSGSSEYETFLRRRATELGVEQNVIWRGFVEHRTHIYRDLALLVVPSRSDDPLPTTAIEASFFGIPVIASRRGGLPEIIEHGVTGLLFDAGNYDELAHHLVALLDDDDLRKRMGQNARERISVRFSRDRFVQEFVRLLKPTV